MAKDGAKVAPKFVPPEDEQEPNESRRYVFRVSTPVIHSPLISYLGVFALCCHTRLWSKLTAAIVAKDMEAATEAKTAVEESQRELRREMEESGKVHVPRFFAQNKDGRWLPKFSYVAQLLAIILRDR